MKDSPGHITIIDRLSALSEPTRLRLLHTLQKNELSVGELARVLQMPQSTVSRHLKILTESGWLIRRAEGTATLYNMHLDELLPSEKNLWIQIQNQIQNATEFKTDLQEDHRRLQAVLAERRVDSQSFFGQHAGEWDDLRTNLFGSHFTAQALLSLIPPNWTIADLGCGTGNASEYLSPRCHKVIAIDSSAPMLKAAQLRLHNSNNVQFIEADLNKLPLPDASVDAAVCLLVLHHLPDPVHCLREAGRILTTRQNGGSLLIVDMHAHDRMQYKHQMGHQHLGFSTDHMNQLLKTAGFDDIRNISLLPDSQCQGPGLFAATARIHS